MKDVYVNIWDDFLEYDSSYIYVEGKVDSLTISKVLTHIQQVICDVYPEFNGKCKLIPNDWDGGLIIDVNSLSYNDVDKIVELFSNDNYALFDDHKIIMYSES